MMIRPLILALLFAGVTAAGAQVQRVEVNPGNIVANEFSLDAVAAADIPGSTTFTLKILNNNRLKGPETIGVWLSGSGFHLPLRITKELGGYETIRFTVADTHLGGMAANVGFGSAWNNYAREYQFALLAFNPAAVRPVVPAPVVPPVNPQPVPAAAQPAAPVPPPATSGS